MRLNFSGLVFLLPFFGFVFGYLFSYIFFQSKELSVPNIIGKNLQDSVKIASRNGLSIKLLREQEDSDLPQGVILKQIPREGQKIRINQSILVTISKKPKPIITPDFSGLTHREIVLNSKRYGIQNKSFWLKSIYPVDICISQYPVAGQILHNQKLITYFSSGQNNMFIVPNFKDYTLGEIKEKINYKNIFVEVVNRKRCENKSDDHNSIIIDQKPLPGSIVDMERPLRIQLEIGT